MVQMIHDFELSDLLHLLPQPSPIAPNKDHQRNLGELGEGWGEATLSGSFAIHITRPAPPSSSQLGPAD
jgi:hypothetical protein